MIAAPMKLTFTPLVFELADGRTISVPPPTLGQVRAALELDPASAEETPTQTLLRIP